VLWRPFDATWHVVTAASTFNPGAAQTWTWGAPATICTPAVTVIAAPPASPPVTGMWQATDADHRLTPTTD